MHLYVFPSTAGPGPRVKLNIEKGRLHLFCGDSDVTIDPTVMRDGSSAMVLYKNRELYTLYNFREILQVMNMTPKEFLSSLGISGFLQADKDGDDLFVKTFLPQGQETLDSDTDDFSGVCHMTADMIHPLDWAYSWTFEFCKAELKGDELILTMLIEKSAFKKRAIHVTHGGQTCRAKTGEPCVYRFRYVPGEDVYLGEPRNRYKGRAIDLGRLLGGEAK